MTSKMKKKMQSRRWWVVLWAISYVTGMSIYGVAANNSDVWIAIAIIGGIIVSYMTISSLKKKKESEIDKEEGEE